MSNATFDLRKNKNTLRRPQGAKPGWALDENVFPPLTTEYTLAHQMRQFLFLFFFESLNGA